jgi:3'-phosphoadenosine 5'-phosphosulfate sulfotransferase (PAPS reductase)/FAD synthetase
MKKVRHVLGISGGKDSAALAVYMKVNYPDLDIEYYTSDTGKELEETYKLIDNLENYLGKKIVRLRAFEDSSEDPFDHKLKSLGGFLPSAQFRWCTKNLKLDTFEAFVGDDPVVSYVGIRGDEEREGYISTKSNIQSIFPFRQNIWSEDVIRKVLKNENIDFLIKESGNYTAEEKLPRFLEVLKEPVSNKFSMHDKLNSLLGISTKAVNYLVFSFIKGTEYPLSREVGYDLLENEDNLVRADIFKILEDSTVGVPKYYKPIEFEVNGKKGTYARSRSGCYFCFYQQKIEWVWLYEQHPDLFEKAVEYEKIGYKWNQDESLLELIKPERIQKIKEDYIKRTERKNASPSPYLLDILSEAEGEGCASCFI